ncbi:gamma-glutamyltransferase [Micromonospora sp. STR1s_5]|nr:gamma-glutamyltransferase [Micromonospora sp. STR1s_5]
MLQPATGYARDGWFVRPAVHTFWSADADMGRAGSHERLAFSASGRALYCRADGTPKRVGEWVRNPDYAATLTRIAEHGAEDFYTGEIGARIAADMDAHGALLSARDLAEFRPLRSAPLQASYRGYRVTTNQPPGGGVMLVEMLNILEAFDLCELGHNTPEYIQTVCEAMKRATIDKDRSVGDPRFVDVPLERLTSEDYGRRLAEEIRSGRKAEVVRLSNDLVPSDTTQVSVVDGDGNCVSMTHSLGMPSGVITDGLGFMYNGCMAVFDPRPGRAGSIAPGKARFSAMCPTIVFKGDKPHIVLGAPGGTQITMGVLQALLNVIDFGMNMQDAVSAPRFSSTSNAIDVSNRIPRVVERSLQEAGYRTVRNPFGYTFGWVHGIRITPDGLEGGADPGRDGVAMSTAAH